MIGRVQPPGVSAAVANPGDPGGAGRYGLGVTRPRSFLTDGDHYDACHAYLVADLPFWTSLVAPGMRVLELGCGTGRVAVPLAAAGAVVTGLEVSPALLARARGKSREVEWVRGDMRSFALGRRFDLVAIAFNTLLVLVERAHVLACLACVRDHLVSGGRLVIDTVLVQAERIAGAGVDEPLTSYRTSDGVDVRVTRRCSYDMVRQLRRVELTIHSSDRAEPEHDVLETHIAFPWELALLLEGAGFQIDATYGDYAGGPLVATSRRCLLVASLP